MLLGWSIAAALYLLVLEAIARSREPSHVFPVAIVVDETFEEDGR